MDNTEPELVSSPNSSETTQFTVGLLDFMWCENQIIDKLWNL